MAKDEGSRCRVAVKVDAGLLGGPPDLGGELLIRVHPLSHGGIATQRVADCRGVEDDLSGQWKVTTGDTHLNPDGTWFDGP